MYLFWIMFNFGLPTAILIHFLYDLAIFMTIATLRKIDNWRYT